MTAPGDDAKAQEAADAVHKELMSSGILGEHGLSVERKGTYLEVRKGQLELVGVAFNYRRLGFCLITNFVQNFPSNTCSFHDRKTEAEGIIEFRRQMKLALEKFLRHQQEFAFLGLG